MSNKPFPVSPRNCFAFGFIVAVLLGAINGPLPAEFLAVGNALFSAVTIGMSSALIFWYVSKRMKEGMFPFLCIIFGNIFGAAAITLFQGVDIVYVTVRLVGGFIVACLVYQYFVKKIK